MQIAVQWTKANPTDWEWLDSQSWVDTRSKPDPTGRPAALNNLAGWVHAINVQGLWISGYDHYAVEDLGGSSCRVTSWIDTRGPGGDREALQVTFELLQPNQYGAWDTKQTFVRYAEGEVLNRLNSSGPVYSTGGQVQVFPYSAFSEPPSNLIRHGKMVPDSLHEAHVEVRKKLRYDVDFLEGVPSEEVVNGKLRDQAALGRRRPKEGTRTFYLTDSTTGTYSVHTLQTSSRLMTETGDAGTDGTHSSGNFTAGSDALVVAWVTNTSVPNEGSWPSGTYVGQFRVTTAGGDMNFGWRTCGGSSGHLARINSGLSSDVDSVQQSQAAFTGVGTHTGSASWTPTGSTASDKFEFLLAANRNTGGHGNESFDVGINETASYAEGPWTAVASTTNKTLLLLGA